MASVLTLNESGTPVDWVTWKDAVIYKAKNLVVWEMGAYDWTKYGGVNRISGKTSSITFSSIMAVKGNFHPTRKTPPLNNTNLFGRDLNTCAYCGKQFVFSDLTNDHIVPRSRGGKHSWMNCVTSCKRCNNSKDDMTLEEWGWDLLYSPYIPSREEILIIHNTKILSDQFEYIKPLLPQHSRLLKLKEIHER